MKYAYTDGRVAFRRHGITATNPYPHGTDQYESWVDGWLAEMHGEPVPSTSFHRTIAEIRSDCRLTDDERENEEDIYRSKGD